MLRFSYLASRATVFALLASALLAWALTGGAY